MAEGRQAMTETDLIRFVNAQDRIYTQVVAELTDGCKRTPLDVVHFSATRGPRTTSAVIARIVIGCH